MRWVWVLIVLFVSSCAQVTKEAYLYSASKEELRELKEQKEKPLPPPPESLYQKEQVEKLMKLLREEPTPLAVPPSILRVFVLPYVSESGELITQHYLYIKVDEGRWILGDYLLKKGEAIKEFKPLENEGR